MLRDVTAANTAAMTANDSRHPPAVSFGSSRVWGRGLGRAARGLLAAGRPTAVMRPGR